MLFTASFLANAGLNFVLGLGIAAVLGPEEFGRYAIGAAIALLVNASGFAWIAHATTRFYSERSRREDPCVRATFDRAMFASAACVAVLAVLALAAGPGFGLEAGLVSVSLLVGIGHGFFDYASALARARFMERSFVAIVIVKNGVGFALMLSAAWLFHDARAVLAALAVSTLASLVPVAPALADRQAGRFQAGRLAMAARYAGPAIAAIALYQLIPFVNRGLIADARGFGEAGQFSLAFDTLYRIFLAIGSSLDFILFQLAVREEDEAGHRAARRRLGANVVIVAGALVPAAIGFWFVLPDLAAIVVPRNFREGFVAYAMLLLPAVLAQALVSSALNAVFQLRKRTGPIVAIAALGLVANLALATFLPALAGPAGISLAQSGAMILVLAATLGLAWPVLRGVVPPRDLAGIAAATLLMAAVLWPLHHAALTPLVRLAAMLVLGGIAYLACVTLTDVGGLKRRVEAWLGHADSLSPAAADETRA